VRCYKKRLPKESLPGGKENKRAVSGVLSWGKNYSGSGEHKNPRVNQVGGGGLVVI